MPEICLPLLPWKCCCFPSAQLCNMKHGLVNLLFWFNLVLLLFLEVSHHLDISFVDLSDQLLASVLWSVNFCVKPRGAGCCS